MSSNVRVAVRVRPFNGRETDRGSRCIIEMNPQTQQTTILHPGGGKPKHFTFDYSYNSFVPRDDADYASQDVVWRDLGLDVLETAWQGYNVSLFAYGQTGAGKSYSMVGYGPDRGIIPMASEVIFERVRDNEDPDLTFKVEASMMEIYNENVKDLFNPSAKALKVRDHPKKGPYAEGLTKNAVSSYAQISELIEQGTLNRTTASTAMNATSSRAHTIFQILLTQTKLDPASMKATDTVSRINLIDLAGSERAASTGATGDRLKEGAAINKSLSALGNVISALAARSAGTKAAAKVLVPYRDSKLTHLLKDSLGGNAKTIMIAALSPADINYDETLSTLRYADRAKQIKNKAVINEDPNARIIRELKEQLEQLKMQVTQGGSTSGPSEADLEAAREEIRLKMQREMEEYQQRLQEREQEWQARLLETEEKAKQQAEELAAKGLGRADEACTVAHLVNLNEDEVLNEKLRYHLDKPSGVVTAGRGSDADIHIGGLGITDHHCSLTVTEGTEGTEVSLSAGEGAKCFVNGVVVEPAQPPRRLRHGDRVILGNNNVFRLVVPPAPADASLDWTFAMKELAAHTSQMAQRDEELEKALGEQKEQLAAQIAEMEGRMQSEKAQLALEQEAKEKALAAQVQQMAAEMRQREEEMRAKGGVEQGELERRIAERERELEQSQREAEERFRSEQRELVLRQQALEQKLRTQVAETEKLAARKVREMQAQQELDDSLVTCIPLASEATQMAAELGKNLLFEPTLLAAGGGAAGSRRGAEASADAGPDEVWLQVTRQEDGDHVLWQLEKFYSRMYLMREMYQAYMESGYDLDVVLDQFPEEVDPFYDPPEDQLIGQGRVFLESLTYLLDIEVPEVAVLNLRGLPSGSLNVEVLCEMDDYEDSDGENSEAENSGADADLELRSLLGQELHLRVRVNSAQGLPPHAKRRNVYVSFQFYGDQVYHSRRIRSSLTDPNFDCEAEICVPVTQKLLRFVKTGQLVVQVWSGQSSDGEKQHRAAPRSSSEFGPGSGSGSGSGSEAGSEDDEEEEEAEHETWASPAEAKATPSLGVSASAPQLSRLEEELADAKAQLDETLEDCKLRDMELECTQGLVDELTRQLEEQLGAADALREKLNAAAEAKEAFFEKHPDFPDKYPEVKEVESSVCAIM